MSRHRNVRALNIDEECEGYDDIYGHSMEDDFCVSPGTAAQFTYNRDSQYSQLSSFMKGTQIQEEEEEAYSDHETDQHMSDSGHFQSLQLSDIDKGRLHSCLEEINNIIGDTIPESKIVDAVIASDYNMEKALDKLLNQSAPVEAPLPQRVPRDNRRNRAKKGSAVPKFGQPEVPKPKFDPHQEEEKVARLTFSASKATTVGFGVSNGVDNLQVPSDGANSVNTTPKVSPCTTPIRGSPGGSPILQRKSGGGDVQPESTPSKSKFKGIDRACFVQEFEKRNAGKDMFNLVVIGHVDAGKSTLMGHLLYKLGCVSKRNMHKYEQESKKLGKASFAYAWVLDETEEERSRGVTMDVAQTEFTTATKIVTLLDAPGHKDFIPNMITGAAQADVAVLVVNATRGEFETGFELGGQTREHAFLVRALGVSQMVVAINKMDTVGWDQDRYNEITKKLGQFLKQAGFKETDISFVPCSGLSGENLTECSDKNLKSWYSGPSLVQQIDKLEPPTRLVDKPFRMCVADIFKGMGSGFSISGRIEAGGIQPNDRVLVMPIGEQSTIKVVMVHDETATCAIAGEYATVVITGIDQEKVHVGSILCDPVVPIRSTTRVQARIVIFNIAVPITKGFPVEFHYQTLSEPAFIRKLISQLHKSSGEVVRRKPRCLTKHSSAVVEIELSRPVCIELYSEFKDLGRFMLRYGGSTIAAGLVTEILTGKSAKPE